MQENEGKLLFEVRADQSDIKKDIEAIKKQFESLTKKTQEEGEKQAQVWQNLIKGATAYFTFQGASAFIKQVIAVRSQFQQLEIAFGTMLKSKEKANALMAQMTDLAAKTPFGLQEVSEGAKRLLAFQVPAQEVTETLRRMGDVAAGLGVPMGQLIHVYGQVKAQGKLMTNDLYQFMNAGIPIIAELSKVVGKSETEIKDMVSAGKIGFAEVQAVIKGMTDEGGLFYNLMAEQSKTLSGQLSNLEDNFDNMLNEIGKATEGIASGAISSVSFLVENYQTLGKIIAGLIATYGAYRTAVLVNIALTKGWAVAAKEDAIAKGIQTIATNAATVATKALNAAMKANPYVLVATAVVGLGAAIWALKDNTTAAEKAQQDYNNQKQQAIDWEQQHKQKIDDLIESATNQALADTERQKALIALQNEYPNIFAKYDIETLKLADILKLKQEIAKHDSEEKKYHRTNEFLKYQDFEKALNKAKTGKSTYDISKLKNSILDEEMTRVFGKNWFNGSNLSDVEKYIKERQKIAKNDVKGDVIASWTSNLKNLSEDEIKKELEHRQKLITDLQKQKKAGNKWASHGVNFGGDWFAFNEEELQAQSKTLQAQLDKLHEQTYSYTDLSKKYATAVKKAEQELADITNNKAGYKTESDYQKAVAEAKENLKQAKKVYDDFSVSKNKGTKNQKTKSELPTFDYEKAAREEARREQDFLFQKEQASINIMEDGAQKRLAIIQLDYDRQEEEIRRRTEDQMAAFIEQQKAQAEAEGKWKRGQSFNENTTEINAHKAKLQTEEQQLLASNHDYMLYQQEQVYKQLLEKYQTYTDQRKAIEEKYNADIAALQAKLGADAPQVKKAQDEKARELKKLDILYKKEGTAIAKLFENMRKKTVKEIRETIADAEKEIDQLASMLDMGDKDNVDYIQNLKQQLEQARDTADRSDTVFGRLGKNIQSLFKFKPNTIEWKEALQGVLSDAQSITGEFGQIGDEFERLGQSTGNAGLKKIGENIKDFSNIVSKTVSFAQIGGSVGGGWGAAIGGVIGAVYGIYEKIGRDREQARQAERQWKEEQIQFEKKLNDLYDERILKGQKFINAFTENKIGKQIDVIKNYKDKIDGLRKKLIDVQNSQVISHYDKKWVTDKALGFIPLGAHQESIARTKAFKDKYQKLVDDFGNIDFEFLERLNENDLGAYFSRIGLGTAEIDEGLRRVISDAKEVNNKLKEYREEIDKYTKETFGPLGANFSDSIISAVEKGESAFENFGQTVSRVMKNVIKQTLVTQNIKNLFDDFDKAVGDIYTKGIGLSNEQLYENVKNKTIEFVNNTLKPEIQKGEQKAKAMFDALEQSGIKMYDDRGIGRQAVEKGYMRMSQDTGDELLGQQRLLTELQKQTKDGILQAIEYYKGFTNSFETLKNNLAQQLQHLAGIEANTYKLNKMETDLASLKRGMDELTTRGIKIRS
ncbi:tape measure protein [Capnocytophaga gingivalis]|uniref:Tape measure protein n=1 Tax=Capnocytophaga gingivalis TaxID=1017 RepID=A0ABU5ZBX8_9FLAO|nr:tape measure protein [Capnocytophaga gingivalis]MEB3074991.1 tape measure protein [Capnocytophaga gingivalis]